LLFASSSSASKSEIRASSLSALQQTIGSGSETQKSLLVEGVTQFIAQSKILTTAGGDIAMKRAFVDKGIALADSLNNAKNRVDALRLGADNDLKAGIVKLNSKIQELNLLNQNILTSRFPQMLYDNRDSLIQEISQKLAVDVYFGHNG